MSDMVLDPLFNESVNEFTNSFNGVAKVGQCIGNLVAGMTGGNNCQSPQPQVQQPMYGQQYDPNSRIYSNGQSINPYAQVQQNTPQSVNYGYGYSSNPNNPYNMNINYNTRMYPGISNPKYGM